MATLLKGAQAAAAMNERTAARAAALTARGIVPTLAVVRMGAREDDLSYERGVINRCAKVGVAVKPYLLEADASQAQLLAVVEEINQATTANLPCRWAPSLRPSAARCPQRRCATA